MIIDCHGHLVPAPLLDAIRAQRAAFPSVRLIEEADSPSGAGSLGFGFAGSKPTRPVPKMLVDVAERIQWMNQQGIDRQVCGGWLDSFGYEIPVAEGANWSRLMNQHLLAAAKAEPRIVPLACVPMQNGAAAAEVLREAVAAGFAGTMIGTQPKGVGGVLDDKDLDPFWQAADELGAVVFIHPVFESGDDRVHDYGMANAVGRLTDTLIAVSRLLYSGHILKYRNAKIVISVGGAALPYALGRLKRNHAISKGLADPEAGLKALYYDTVVQDVRVLRFMAEMVGRDRLMMGSDFPFPIGDLEPRKVVAEAGFSAREIEAIDGGLAARLFRIGG